MQITINVNEEELKKIIEMGIDIPELAKITDDETLTGYSISAFGGDVFGHILKYQYIKDKEGNNTEYGEWEIENAKALGKWRFPNSFEDICTLLIKELKFNWNIGGET